MQEPTIGKTTYVSFMWENLCFKEWSESPYKDTLRRKAIQVQHLWECPSFKDFAGESWKNPLRSKAIQVQLLRQSLCIKDYTAQSCKKPHWKNPIDCTISRKVFAKKLIWKSMKNTCSLVRICDKFDLDYYLKTTLEKNNELVNYFVTAKSQAWHRYHGSIHI